MPQSGVITLNEKPYNPGGSENKIFSWLDRSGGVPNGFGVLTESVRPGVGQAVGTTKVQWKLKLPTVATTSDSCQCAGEIMATNTIDLTFTLDNASLKAVRTDLLAQLADLVSNADFIKSVEDIEPTW